MSRTCRCQFCSRATIYRRSSSSSFWAVWTHSFPTPGPLPHTHSTPFQLWWGAAHSFCSTASICLWTPTPWCILPHLSQLPEHKSSTCGCGMEPLCWRGNVAPAVPVAGTTETLASHQGMTEDCCSDCRNSSLFKSCLCSIAWKPVVATKRKKRHFPIHYSFPISGEGKPSLRCFPTLNHGQVAYVRKFLAWHLRTLEVLPS